MHQLHLMLMTMNQMLLLFNMILVVYMSELLVEVLWLHLQNCSDFGDFSGTLFCPKKTGPTPSGLHSLALLRFVFLSLEGRLGTFLELGTFLLSV